MEFMEKRRRQLFILLSLGLLAMVNSAPLADESRPQVRRKSLASPPKNSGIEEVGNPVDLAWQAWILVDQGGGSVNAGGGLDSASLLRRITPKSIFIAPSLQALPACAEGYQADPMNRCVKNVNINQEAHLDFLIQRLNAKFSNLGNNNKQQSSSSSGSVPTGPLQLDLLNIPILIGNKDKTDENKQESADETPQASSPASIEAVKEIEEDSMINVNEDKDGDEGDTEQTFFHEIQATKDGSENDEGNSTKYEGMVPIVDFVDDTNSSFSDVIDYKVESEDNSQNNKNITDEMHNQKIEIIANLESHKNNTKASNDSSSLAPTVVLLLTPTNKPASSGDLIVAHNSTTGKLSIRRDNRENGTVSDEIIAVNLPDHLATASTPIQIFFNSSTSTKESLESTETTTLSSEIADVTETEEPDEMETEFFEDYTEDPEDIEDSTESEDEILAHSEASGMITMPPYVEKLISADNNKEIINEKVIDKNDEMTSKVSSETSINDDFIRETILLGLNINKELNTTMNSTKPVKITTTTTTTTIDDEKITTSIPEFNTEPEVTYLPEETSTYIDDLETESTTVESSEKDKEFTTPTESLTKQTEFPVTTRIYEAFSPDQLNPVIKIEELSFIDEVNRQPSSPPIINQQPEEPDSSEIMTASSSNNAESFFPEIHQDNSPIFPPPVKQNNRKRIGPYSNDYPSRSETKYVTVSDNNQNIQTEIKTFDDESSEYNGASDTENFFEDQRIPSPSKEFIRFPTYEKLHNRPDYVRFPSDEANSIHTPDDLKDRLHHRPFVQQNYRGSLKNPLNSQNNVNWPSWRNDRQSIRTRSGQNEKQKDRSPIWFWTRMPLVRDPSHIYHPTHSSMANFERQDARVQGSRRINYYKEISSHDTPRAFARSSTIGG
uniref:Folded gastrulation N-terminal domain-containing protein n=1 Tax=Bracon brevicornis TaxID=1563983 RepID=A0A6V7JXY3_9HYME